MNKVCPSRLWGYNDRTKQSGSRNSRRRRSTTQPVTYCKNPGREKSATSSSHDFQIIETRKSWYHITIASAQVSAHPRYLTGSRSISRKYGWLPYHNPPSPGLYSKEKCIFSPRDDGVVMKVGSQCLLRRLWLFGRGRYLRGQVSNLISISMCYLWFHAEDRRRWEPWIMTAPVGRD